MVKRFLREYGLTIGGGIVLTHLFASYMENMRGCSAIGGELFVLPLLFLAVDFVRQIREDGLLDCLFEDEEEE